MEKSEFIKKMVGFGRRLSEHGLDPKPLIQFGQRLQQEDESDLASFVEKVVRQPNLFRERWMGQTALRRARLSPPYRLMLDALGITPDLLGPLHRRFDERFHTHILRWALSPPTTFFKEARKAFVELIRYGTPKMQAVPLVLGDTEEVVSVFTERSVAPHGRVDLWLESDKSIFVVEMKVLASEGEDQVKRYVNAAKEHCGGKQWVVVFMTVGEDQEPSGPAIHITFRDFLMCWLPIAVSGNSQDHRYLISYLSSVAVVCGLHAKGAFDDWSFSQRGVGLDLIESIRREA